MSIKRRCLINWSAVTASTGLVSTFSSCNSDKQPNEIKTSPNSLHSIMGDVVPVSVQERVARIEKAHAQ